MASKSRKRKAKGRKKPNRGTTSLAAHRQHGKQLQPPLKTIGDLRLTTWLRDQFPDYLWVCSILSEELERGTRTLNATLDHVNNSLDVALNNCAEARPVLDGSLSSWEAIPEAVRPRVLEDLRVADLYELAVPETFAHVLGMYPKAPGSWLIQRWRDSGLSIDPELAESRLNETIRASFHGRDPVATRAKAFALRGFVLAGRIYFGQDVKTVELLPRYPHELNQEEVARVEGFIRASFGALHGLRDGPDEGRGDSDPTWPAQFWRANWRIFSCHLAESGARPADEDVLRRALRDATTRLNALWRRFEDTALKTDPDLYNPDRYEVLTGITARALRVLTAAVHSPAAWTVEHSAPLLRSMVEALITLTWLAHREDRSLYSRFKDFGRGHLKLWKLHLEEYADSLDEVPQDVGAQLDDLQALVNEELSEEFQDIDIGGSFAGVDMRKMAYEVGLEQDYRLVLAPASADFHGEWGHLARYALTWCRNPAHRFHRVPRQDVEPDLSPSVIQVALDFAERVVDTYVTTI